MNKRIATPNRFERSAQKYFANAEGSAETAKGIARKKRAIEAAHTAKLRALRLAKEAADKEVAARLAVEAAEANPSKRPAPVVTRRKIARKRMFY